MKIDMIMPQMGESIVEGTIVKWRKRVGEKVDKDEVILDISTDKVDSEIPSPVSGTLAEILAEEGETVSVGAIIARVDSEDGKGFEKKEKTKTPEEKSVKTARPEVDISKVKREEKKFLSPVVRKIARVHGLTPEEVAFIEGSGANGRVTKQDILTFIEQKKSGFKPVVQEYREKITTPAKPTEPPVVLEGTDQFDIIEMDHVRKRIAEHMVMSKRTSAHVTSVAEVDVTKIVKYRESVKKSFQEREGFSLTYTAFFIFAAAKALREYAFVNASVEGDKIILKKNINIGFAVGMDKGLIVPVIKGADRLNLVGIARAVSDLANRARNKQLIPDDVQDGTFSMTNIGTYGNLFGIPIINQPQVAILGTGAIKKRLMVMDDESIAVRSMMYIGLTYDHRIIDGLYAGSFLQRIIQLLENFEIEK